MMIMMSMMTKKLEVSLQIRHSELSVQVSLACSFSSLFLIWVNLLEDLHLKLEESRMKKEQHPVLEKLMIIKYLPNLVTSLEIQRVLKRDLALKKP
jgi:hypothetical protein